jgi:hypothetical protein
MDKREFIKDISDMAEGYGRLVRDYESRGLHNLDSEEIETYGSHLGKLELCEHLLAKYGEK